MPRPTLATRARLATTAGLATLTCLVSTLTAAAAPQQYWTDPGSQAAAWVARNPGDPRAQVIRTGIAEVPGATWLVGGSPSANETRVRTVVGQARAAGKVALLVLYNIPGRDCGLHSAGGAAGWAAYRDWIGGVARGLDGAGADVVLEPDALASVLSCAGADRTALTGALAEAVRTLRAASPGSRLYLDAGHSRWVAAGQMAELLKQAGITAGAAGISTNVSNYNTTGDEVAYAQSVLHLIGDGSLGALIDTSRNGNGPRGTWCDPSGAATGQRPTRATGIDRIDAFAWVKAPGEADGCVAAAGTFLPQVAYEQAAGGVVPSPTPTPSAVPLPTFSATPIPPTPTPMPTATPTVSPTPTVSATPPPAPTPTPSATASVPTTPPTPVATCRVESRVVSSWITGYQVEFRVRAETAVEGWSLTWTLPAGHRIDQLWNGVADIDSGRVVVSSAGWNTALPAGGETVLGAIVSAAGGSTTAPIATCVAAT